MLSMFLPSLHIALNSFLFVFIFISIALKIIFERSQDDTKMDITTIRHTIESFLSIENENKQTNKLGLSLNYKNSRIQNPFFYHTNCPFEGVTSNQSCKLRLCHWYPTRTKKCLQIHCSAGKTKPNTKNWSKRKLHKKYPYSLFVTTLCCQKLFII